MKKIKPGLSRFVVALGVVLLAMAAVVWSPESADAASGLLPGAWLPIVGAGTSADPCVTVGDGHVCLVWCEPDGSGKITLAGATDRYCCGTMPGLFEAATCLNPLPPNVW